jgi:predicted O-methyltransferase YrrM
MNALTKFACEVAAAPRYRCSATATLRYAWAKWLFRRFRQNDPRRFLEDLGINTDVALQGFERWLPMLTEAASAVRSGSDVHGGIGLDDGVILYGLARALKPDYIIETGTAAGVSTSFFAAALVENGHGWLFSIELPPGDGRARLADGSIYGWQDRGVGWAIPRVLTSALGHRHQLILRDVRQVLPEILRELPYIDIFFHDDLHTPDHMLWEYEVVWPKLRPGGVLASDDVNYGWIEFCRRIGCDNAALRNVDRFCALRKPPQYERDAVSEFAGPGPTNVTSPAERSQGARP